jgi:hypothetical protein
VDHPQGQGHILTQPCQVTFTVFVPKNLDETPNIVWVSHGCHSHPPPPPTKSPQQYLDEILGIIRRINDPSLTTGTTLFITIYKHVANIIYLL